MRNLDTYTALTRFGLGARPDEGAAVGDDPRGWLEQQIAAPFAVPPELAGFRASDEIFGGIQRARVAGNPQRRQAIRQGYRQDYRGELVARLRHHVRTEAGFTERMVCFWSNHFTVSTTRNILGPVIPAYEREVIRPHVFGRFRDMLRAAIRHPVMLVYLDNTASMGPNSEWGEIRTAQSGTTRTLNENLAREVLELHTLGVGGGYRQEDVEELALALTGWGHDGQGRRVDPATIHGRFKFFAPSHEPGQRRVMGRLYPEGGAEQALEILDDLAMHPSTARHLATKLVRHFVSDTPPEADIARIARVYLESGGDLAAVSRAVIALESPWRTPLSKLKSHYEFVISAHRASWQRRPARQELLEPLTVLGQTPFTAPSPQGWGDTAGHWLSPEALTQRIDWARRFATTWSLRRRPSDLLDGTIGPVASPGTLEAVIGATPRDQAFALLLVSPEFQRR